MTAWWMIVTAAGLFVLVLLVLRKIPARPGSEGSGSSSTPNPVLDHDPIHSPHWHHRHDPPSSAIEHSPTHAGGSTSESGGGGGGGGQND